MAIIGNLNPTLVDVAKATDSEGRILGIIELLSQTNEMLTDMGWVEANGTTGHRTTVRTGLPTAIWRKLYQGVPTSKSTRAQVTDTVAQLAARSEIDKDLADLNGNTAAFRLQEAQAFVEAMNQTMMQTVLYGNDVSAPEKFMGLAPRYSSLSAANARNIIDGGGTGSDNTSVWLVVWGPSTLHGIYPKGLPAGLQHEDLGVGDAFDENNNRYRAYMDLWKWNCGLCVRDWRFAVRIANIDASNLKTGTGAADLVKLMIRALHLIPGKGMGRAAFYANEHVITSLDLQTQDKAANTIMTGNDVFGQPALMCRGIPIRTVDAILNTEARVV